MMSRMLLNNRKISQLSHLFNYSTNSLKLNKTINTSHLQNNNKKDEDLIRLKKINDNYKFNQNVKAYVDVCCRSDKLINNALNLIENLTRVENDANNLESKYKKDDSKEIAELDNDSEHDVNNLKLIKHDYYISDVEIYNKLMFSLAKNGQTNKIIRLFNKMRTFAKPVDPNLNSYVAALQSIGHNLNNDEISSLDKTRLTVERIINDIKKSNLSIDNIATSLHYSSEQQKDIKKALNLSIPNFIFKDIEDITKQNSLFFNLKQIKYDQSNSSYLPKEILKKEKILKNYNDQIRREQDIMISIPSILKDDEKSSKKKDKDRSILLENFRNSITKSFLTNLKLLKVSQRRDDIFIYPFLAIMDASVYIDTLVKEVCILAQSSSYFSNSIQILSLSLSSRLEKKYQEFCMTNDNDLEKMKKIYEKYIEYKIESMKNPTQNNSREEWLEIMRKEDLFLKVEDNSWPTYIKNIVGRFLLENILIKSCYIPVSFNIRSTNNFKNLEKAFYRIYRITGVYKDPQLKIHPQLIHLFDNSLTFESNRMPMIAPPLPWYSPIKGGYFLSKSDLLRLNSGLNEQRIMIERTDQSSMYPIYDSLNTLSSCAWRINKPILDILIDVFNNNDANNNLDVALHSSQAPIIPKIKEEVSNEEYKAYLKEKDQTEKVKSEMHSLWCTELYRLSIANMFRDTIIWFPHSLDFRGRSYPIPPHFNHLGCDISRSLIIFAEGKKLGKNGLNMLKIHLINLTGTMKKSTLEERLAFADSIIDDIIDSAEKPLDGKKWWQKSEEKWQTLACCIEIANAVKFSNHEEFISHYPIHQDGSCNGLQHYAALGRDEDGAKSVNLDPSERPQDVYSTVLDIVEDFRKSEENTNEIAKLLKGHVQRKVIKQTVMTTVYNVTFYGAKLQIRRQLEYLNNFPQDKTSEASIYLATKTFESIRKLFFAAKDIQDWLSQCAVLISKERNNTVKWLTPLGLPISQPYFKKNSDFSVGTDKKSPDNRKQRNAFPPNYIHSLDSCHMMLTSIYCEKAGVTFASVHDCFWTHASTTDMMNRICREQFVALHTLPLLENLSKFFLDNYGYDKTTIDSELNPDARNFMIEFNKVLSNVPKKGSFDLNNVLKSVYFFS